MNMPFLTHHSQRAGRTSQFSLWFFFFHFLVKPYLLPPSEQWLEQQGFIFCFLLSSQTKSNEGEKFSIYLNHKQTNKKKQPYPHCQHLIFCYTSITMFSLLLLVGTKQASNILQADLNWNRMSVLNVSYLGKRWGVQKCTSIHYIFRE